MTEWLLVFAMGAVGACIGSVMIFAGRLIGPRPRPLPEKVAPYECGVPILGETRERIAVKYYLVAVLFVIFDVETVLLIPWAVVYRELGPAGLLEVLAFIAVLAYGLLYAWRARVFDWNK